MIRRIITMITKERKDARRLLVQFGVALVLSFSGFLYSRIRTKRIKPPDSAPSAASSSGSDGDTDYGGRLRIKEDPCSDMDSETIDTHDKPCNKVRLDSSSMNASPSAGHTRVKEGLLLPEFDQLVREFEASTSDNVATSPKGDVATFMIDKEAPEVNGDVKRDDYKHEIETLKKRIRFLRERESRLEFQLLEYYGIKEQESLLMEIQNRLKVNNIEAKLFSMRIESLQAENKRLEAQVSDHSKVVSELEAAKMKIRQLKRKVRHVTEQRKEQIMELAQRVAKLRCQEHESSKSAPVVHLEQQILKDLEHETDELRESNEKLQHENTDVAQKLESTQFIANSNLEDPEREELYKEMLHLREENETLAKEVDRIRSDRCADTEELVYLRWINACLRYELRNYQPPPGKTVARDLSKSLSPTSEQKAKQLILEYANSGDGENEASTSDIDLDHWPSSQSSYFTDDHEDSQCNSSTNINHTRKVNFFAKLRGLIRGKHGHHHRESSQPSPLRRSLSDGHGRKYSFECPRRSEPRFCDQRSGSRSAMLSSSSKNSNTSKLEYQPLSSLAEEDAHDIKNLNSTSYSGSCRVGVRFVLGKGSECSFSSDCKPEQNAEDVRNSELSKYAEVLRNSQWAHRMHKKSASFSAGCT